MFSRSRVEWPLALASAAAGALVVVGALGPWGALSSLPTQAAIVALTRWIVVALGAAGLILSLLSRHAAVRILALVAFAAAAVLLYGEVRYEKNQAFQHGRASSTWGLTLATAAALAGAGVWAGVLVRGLVKRRAR